MAKDCVAVVCWLLIFFMSLGRAPAQEKYISPEEKETCKFFGQTRKVMSGVSMTNCTWYADRSCCKRTEVTSVFGSMYKINNATTRCRNMINYLMCYFCSPDQYLWYRGGLHVCVKFCEQLFGNCSDSTFKDIPLNVFYTSGRHFCESQQFKIVEEGEGDCFDFDPTAFDVTSPLTASVLISLILPSIAVLLQWTLRR